MIRIIGHLDMDAFFASVEERYTPRFRGFPIAVGSEPNNGQGRGVVSTANYKAREYGIHSAMPIGEAWRLSQEAKKQGKPEVVFLPVDFELYNKSSANIFRIIKKYCESVEPASIDEFYYDLSSYGNPPSHKASAWRRAEDICKKIKSEIKKEEKITCSIGIGPNKLISKIAAGFKKPDGFFVVEEKDAENFLKPMKIGKIPGIGPKTEEILNKLGVEFVSDLKKFSKEKMHQLLHKWGEDLYDKIRGIDNEPIVENREVKSIGEQTTFEKDTLEALYVGDVLAELCEDVFEKFLQSGFDKFKTIVITVRFTGFETKTSSKSLEKELGEKDLKKFKMEALKLLLPYLDKRKNPSLKKIRLIGVRVENFSKIVQKELF
jgi:DNA polymerase IV (DinB-like DNA polymerase)